MDMFCELAKGAVDFLAFRDALKETNFSGFAVVEQDMYPAPFDKPLPLGKAEPGLSSGNWNRLNPEPLLIP